MTFSSKDFRTLANTMREAGQREIMPRFCNLSAEAVPSTVELVLRGSREGLSHIEPGHINAFVDLVGLGPGEYPMDVRVDAEADAFVARIDPAAVRVRITGPRD